jgi:hypothetical protein
MKKSIIVAVIVTAIAVPAIVYAASPLFINNTINEPLPGTGDKPIEDAAMTDKNDDAVMAELAGSFVGVGDGIHNAEGVAKILYLKGGSDILRLEDLKATNGPDLHVYLSTDKHASDFVDLGRLKANIGSQNYDIPEGTDLSKYSTVLVWCKQFSVLFGSANLTSGMPA